MNVNTTQMGQTVRDVYHFIMIGPGPGEPVLQSMNAEVSTRTVRVCLHVKYARRVHM